MKISYGADKTAEHNKITQNSWHSMSTQIQLVDTKVKAVLLLKLKVDLDVSERTSLKEKTD